MTPAIISLIIFAVNEAPAVGALIAKYINAGQNPSPDQVAADAKDLTTSDADLAAAYERLFPNQIPPT